MAILLPINWKITNIKVESTMQTQNTENSEEKLVSDNTNNTNENNKSESTNNEKAFDESNEEELSIEEKLSNELAEMKDKYIRMYSEFENFRRRTAKERVELIQNASQNVIKEIIPVVDDFERAQKSFDEAKDIEPIKEGIALIFNKLSGILTRQGLKRMESKDADFDVELHECITQLELGEENKGKVVDVIEKGYYLNDKVIRYAKVVVGK